MKARHLAWVVLFSLACDGKNAETEAGAATKTADGNAPDPQACTSYADQLCEKAGAETATCASIRQTIDLLPPSACAAALAEIEFSFIKLGEARKVCTDLADKLCAELGEGTQSCTMVRRETVNFPNDQCQLMMNEYPQVLAELQQMEERNKPLSPDEIQSLAAGKVPSFGPTDAKVTVVEFSDFQCPYCARAAEVVRQVEEQYGDKARFVFRQYPLPMHGDAHLAAQASLAAQDQGKFWKFHDLMFANQEALDRDSLEQYARDAGMNMGKFRAALDKGTFKDAVDADMKLGEGVFVEGTPTMFVNGVRVENAADFASISQAIDAALSQAG